MADRTLRGSRLGAISYETEYGAEPAPRNVAAYRCARGHEFNVPFLAVAQARSRFDAVGAACRVIGRDDEPVYSVMLTVGIGRTEAEVFRRIGDVQDQAALRSRGVIGSPAQAVDTLGRYAEAGCGRVYLQLMDLTDLDQVELIGSDVMPQL